MKRFLAFTLTIALAVTLVYAQAGPDEQTKKKKKKARPDTTKVKPKPAPEPNPVKKPVPKPEPKAKPRTKAPAPKPKAAPPPEPKPPPKPKEQAEAKPVTPKTTLPPKASSQPRRSPIDSAAVARAVFATRIEAREPVGVIDSLSTESTSIYFYTELVGMQGTTITHRWIHGGKVRAEIPLSVRGARWRSYTRKALYPAFTGEWTAAVVDSAGNVLATKHFIYYQRRGPAAGE